MSRVIRISEKVYKNLMKMIRKKEKETGKRESFNSVLEDLVG